MNCDDVRKLFSDYFDKSDFVRNNSDETDSLEEVSTHLQECPACAAEFEDYVRFINEIKSLPAPELPTGFHDALMRKVGLESRRRKRVAFMPYIAAAAASVLVVMLWVAGAFDYRVDYFTNLAPATTGFSEAVADAAPVAEIPPMAAVGADVFPGGGSAPMLGVQSAPAMPPPVARAPAAGSAEDDLMVRTYDLEESFEIPQLFNLDGYYESDFEIWDYYAWETESYWYVADDDVWVFDDDWAISDEDFEPIRDFDDESILRQRHLADEHITVYTPLWDYSIQEIAFDVAEPMQESQRISLPVIIFIVVMFFVVAAVTSFAIRRKAGRG